MTIRVAPRSSLPSTVRQSGSKPFPIASNDCARTWDEVHLDHDLGGRQGVAVDDVDCGMEVIRWLCKEPREHLRPTRFFVHTHNLVAGLLMVLQMRSSGFTAEFQPFGQDLARVLAHNEPADDHAEAAGVLAHRLHRGLAWASFWRWRARKTECSDLSQSADLGASRRPAARRELSIAGPDCILGK